MTTGRINQVAALAKRRRTRRRLHRPPGRRVSWGQGASMRLTARMSRCDASGAPPLGPPSAGAWSGDSLSAKPTRGSPRGYQPTIRKGGAPLVEKRPLSAGCPVARAAARRAAAHSVSCARGPGGRGHRPFALRYGLRIAHSHKPPLVARARPKPGRAARPGALASLPGIP